MGTRIHRGPMGFSREMNMRPVCSAYADTYATYGFAYVSNMRPTGHVYMCVLVLKKPVGIILYTTAHIYTGPVGCLTHAMLDAMCYP